MARQVRQEALDGVEHFLFLVDDLVDQAGDFGMQAPAAEILGISARTADRYWVYTRAWLRREMEGAGPSEKIETLLLPLFATTAKLVVGSMAIASGSVPSATVPKLGEYFEDAACTQPAHLGANDPGCLSTGYVSIPGWLEIGLAVPPPSEIRPIGAVLQKPMYMYAPYPIDPSMPPRGTCIPAPLDPGRVFYALGPPTPVTALAASVTTAGGAGVHVNAIEGCAPSAVGTSEKPETPTAPGTTPEDPPPPPPPPPLASTGLWGVPALENSPAPPPPPPNIPPPPPPPSASAPVPPWPSTPAVAQPLPDGSHWPDAPAAPPAAEVARDPPPPPASVQESCAPAVPG